MAITEPPAGENAVQTTSQVAAASNAAGDDPSMHSWLLSPVLGIALAAGAGVALFEHTVVRLFDTFDAVAINVVLFGVAWAIFSAAISVFGRDEEFVESITLSEVEEIGDSDAM